ncbi:Retrovirus-related Pol polyprotein from transposon 17.6-like Protein [Tribolium castaneum]|uniref:RNA-directed DNA polymerase n=1 Tax=Tribolium castaneum TaxID=7070 RepID=D6X3E3_TRICA|nr:Retrovirus-related Pol polyprotein from transposon 17.6-like Protein [Tribolium castaneum]
MLITGIRDESVREKLLEKDGTVLTLDKAVECCIQTEAARKQLNEMKGETGENRSQNATVKTLPRNQRRARRSKFILGTLQETVETPNPMVYKPLPQPHQNFNRQQNFNQNRNQSNVFKPRQTQLDKPVPMSISTRNTVPNKPNYNFRQPQQNWYAEELHNNENEVNDQSEIQECPDDNNETNNGIKPNPDKTKAILDYSIPTTPKQLKGFLGLIGYYRKFIKNFAKITKPLTIRLKKDQKIDPNETDYKNCFEFCKNLLTNDSILQYPDFDKQFILTTDASNYAIGAVLSQGTIGSDLPVAFASRTLNEHEINYSTIEKELLAIVWATKYFRPYLYGRKFKIVTDHQPLKWLFSLKEPNSKLVRWRLRLEEFDYEIHYKKEIK